MDNTARRYEAPTKELYNVAKSAEYELTIWRKFHNEAVILSRENFYNRIEKSKIIYKQKLQSTDGKLKYEIYVTNEPKGLIGRNTSHSIFLRQTYNDGKKDYDQYMVDIRYEKEYALSIAKEMVDVAKKQFKNMHISGDRYIAYKNKEQKEISEITPHEIFKSGGFVKTIWDFLNQKIEI